MQVPESLREPATRRETVASFPPIHATTNPYQPLLYAALADLGVGLAPPARLRSAWLWRSRTTVGYLHFHWLSEYYHHRRSALAAVRLTLLAQRLLLARLLGYRIVWTVHEIHPHDRSGWADRVAPHIVARLAHALIVHDESTKRKVIDLLGREPALIPLGSLAVPYGAGRSRAEVRAELAVPEHAVLILAFGLVRRYKHLEDIADALRLVPRDSAPGLVVLVAGQVMDRDVGDALERAARTDDRLALRLEFVPDENVAELFAAADAALITRVDDGTSGVLALAVSFGIPIITANTPGYRDTAERAAASWHFERGDPSSLAAALQSAARDLAGRRDPRVPIDWLPAWPDVARQTAAVYRASRPDGRV